MKTWHKFFLERFAPCTVEPDSFVWPVSPVVFLISDDDNSILPVAQAKSPRVIPHLTGQEILLALSLLNIQNPASPYHCRCYHPAPSPYHLLAGLFKQPPNDSLCFSYHWQSSQPKWSCYNISQITLCLCSKPLFYQLTHGKSENSNRAP